MPGTGSAIRRSVSLMILLGNAMANPLINTLVGDFVVFARDEIASAVDQKLAL